MIARGAEGSSFVQVEGGAGRGIFDAPFYFVAVTIRIAGVVVVIIFEVVVAFIAVTDAAAGAVEPVALSPTVFVAANRIIVAVVTGVATGWVVTASTAVVAVFSAVAAVTVIKLAVIAAIVTIVVAVASVATACTSGDNRVEAARRGVVENQRGVIQDSCSRVGYILPKFRLITPIQTSKGEKKGGRGGGAGVRAEWYKDIGERFKFNNME